MHISTANISKKVIDRAHITRIITWEVCYCLSIAIFTYDFGQFYRWKVKVICNLIAKKIENRVMLISPYVNIYAAICLFQVKHDMKT